MVGELSHEHDTRTDGAPFSKLGVPPEDDSLEAARALAAVEARMFSAVAEPAPVRLGRFEIQERVGRGGMGLVYSAADPKLNRTVAIKVVRPEVGDDTSGDQLLEEAKTLARISDPNVVAILDAGRTGDRVWIAMEFVDSTLKQWLETGPAPGEILTAFHQAGRGLAAAHAAGLVHRDFKPSNVLLRNDGRAVVADFGLARVVTEDGVRGCAGTPFYMSPEQYDGDPVDARSDQFSWCVALHEALYADHPFRGDTLPERQASSAQGLLRQAHDHAPGPLVLAALRRGLAHRPEDRYADMNALLEAVFLEPQRRARRRVLAAAGGGLLCLTAAALIALPNPEPVDPCESSANAIHETWTDEPREAIRTAFAATESPTAAIDAARVVTLIDNYAEEWTSRRRDVCEAALVAHAGNAGMFDRRIACLESRHGDLRSLLPQLMEVDADLARRAPEIAHRLPSLSACEDDDALMAQAPIPEDPSQAVAVKRLREELSEVRALLMVGRHNAASGRLTELRTRADTLGFAPTQSTVRRLQAQVHTSEGEPKAAAVLLEEAAVMAESAGDFASVVQCARELVNYYAQQDPMAPEAEAWFRRGLAGLERIGNPPSPTANLWLARGIARVTAGDLDGARQAGDHAAAVLREAENVDPLMTAKVSSTRGVFMMRGAHLDDALAEFTAAADIYRAEFGESNAKLAGMHTNIGGVYFNRGDLAAARREYQIALEIHVSLQGADSVRLADPLYNLAVIHMDLGEFDEAAALFRRCLDMYARERGPEHQHVGSVYAELAEVEMQRGKPGDADEMFRRAYRIQVATLGPDHPRLDRALRGMAHAAVALGRFDDAIAHQETALRINEGADGPISAGAGAAHRGIASAALAAGDRPRALAEASRALEIYELMTEPVEPYRLAAAQFTMARVLWASEPDEAQRLAKLAHDNYSTMPGRRESVAQWLANPH